MIEPRPTRFSRPVRDWLLVAALLAGLILWPASSLPAQKPAPSGFEPPGPSDAVRLARSARESAKPDDYRSAHFLLHTDLPAAEARQLLARLETMLGLVSKYWGQRPNGVIECYVVKNLNNWSTSALDPAGRAKIEQGAGITLVETLNRGPRTIAAKAVVYAAANPGTAQHEAVHAYCGQTFGRTGPLWYSEGMAEMGQYWQQGESSVNCHQYVVDYLRISTPRRVTEIVGDDATQSASAAMTGDSWQNYAWRWALCHLLDNNPNYSARFRPLGLGYLNGQPVRFADVYGAMLPELDFEYRFFVQHVQRGYRVDLCSWDWSRKFREPRGRGAITARIAANRGWQPSGALVSSKKQYDYVTSGTWRTSADGQMISPDGQDDGSGRLEGVIFHDYKLSDPFPLGASGSFKPPVEGQLFLRCRDGWNSLTDNAGTVSVQIKSSEGGYELPGPSE